MSRARFRYQLEPILLTRQWTLDALRAELAEQNAAIVRQQESIDAVQRESDALAREWSGLAAAGQAVSVERFARTTRYLSELARRVREQDAELQRLSTARDELIDKVVMSQREVEAVEQHRDEMKQKFVQLRLSGDFKVADDQWNTLQAGIITNGC